MYSGITMNKNCDQIHTVHTTISSNNNNNRFLYQCNLNMLSCRCGFRVIQSVSKFGDRNKLKKFSYSHTTMHLRSSLNNVNASEDCQVHQFVEK